MKKRICQIVSAMVFLTIGVLIFAHVSETLRAKTNQGIDMVHSLYQLEKDNIDVLVLGPSHGYSSVQPNILWHDYGITSFLMCSPGQSVASSYYLLQEALKYQKPKVVLLESYFMYREDKYVREERLRQAFDGIRLGKVKLDMLKDFFSEDDLKFEDLLSYYIPFVMYHSRWSELEACDFNKDLYLKGSIQDYNIFPMEDPGVPDVIGEIPEVPFHYFKKIQQLCEESGIQLVAYLAPFGVADGNTKAYKRRIGVGNAFEQYLAEQNIPFLYYHKIPEANINFSTDFRNATHMNTFGAVKISRHLGGYLSQEFNLEDHRQDPVYQSWDEDYEKYRQAAGEHTDTL